MKTFLALTLAALSAAATPAAPKKPLPFCEDIGVEIPETVAEEIAGCDTDWNCLGEELRAKAVFCAAYPAASYCQCL